jgi:hypothetical protein
MPRKDLVNAKVSMIETMISDLKIEPVVFGKINAPVQVNLNGEIEFQQNRLINLQWATTATDTEIESRINELDATLTPEELGRKYKSMKGLTLEAVQTISKIEDLEIALGTHPAVGGA